MGIQSEWLSESAPRSLPMSTFCLTGGTWQSELMSKMDLEDSIIVIFTAVIVGFIIGGIIQILFKFLPLSLIVGVIVYIIIVVKLPNIKFYYFR